MDFGLSEPQNLLGDSIRDFLAQNVPISRVREIMESDTGTDRDLHHQLGEQGIAGLLVAEEYGGVGLDLLDATVVAQQLGRGAAPVSYQSAYVMAPLLLQEAGTEAQREAWLPGVAAGTKLLSVVIGGPSLDDGRLSGSAMFVPDAAVADAFMVRAGVDGIQDAPLLVIPADRDGIQVVSLATVDETRRVAEVRFEAVVVEDADQLTGGDAAAAFDRALAAGRIILSTDALAVAQEGLRIAVDYAKQRQQFNRVIGSFQAVKHMCAETIAEVDPVQSLVWYTAYAWDQRLDEAEQLVPTLKAHATEVASRATETCTQVFGGIGFTQECDMNLYFKRAGYDRQMLGGPAEMRRLAGEMRFGVADRAKDRRAAEKETIV